MYNTINSNPQSQYFYVSTLWNDSCILCKNFWKASREDLLRHVTYMLYTYVIWTGGMYQMCTHKRDYMLKDINQIIAFKFLTRFLLLAKNCARNVKFLAQFLQVLQVSCKKGDIFSACSVHRTCKNLQYIIIITG